MPEFRVMDDRVNILLVDDQPNNLLALESILAETGENLVLAGSGAAALRHLLQMDFAVVLMDVQMPDLDGIQVTRWMRTQPGLATLPVIAMTANAGEEDMRRCLEAGMDDFITKPVRPKTLIDTLARWLKPAEAPTAPSP